MLPANPLVFGCRVGPQRFRVEGAHVVGISLRTRTTPNPERSMWTHGVRRHGRWVPLLDLRPHFGMTDVVPSTVDHFLFVAIEDVVVGFVVDRVLDASEDVDAADRSSEPAAPLRLASLVDVRSAKACIDGLGRMEASCPPA